MRARHFQLVAADNEKGYDKIEVTTEDIRLFDLVPCGGFDVGPISETYYVFRGDPQGENDWSLDDCLPSR